MRPSASRDPTPRTLPPSPRASSINSLPEQRPPPSTDDFSPCSTEISHPTPSSQSPPEGCAPRDCRGARSPPSEISLRRSSMEPVTCIASAGCRTTGMERLRTAKVRSLWSERAVALVEQSSSFILVRAVGLEKSILLENPKHVLPSHGERHGVGPLE